MLSIIRKRDILVHYPYQVYNSVINLLEEAIRNKNTNAIYITLYRVSSDSLVVHHLIGAARKGIKVVAFVEVKARFDEESNFRWAEEMAAAGVRVIYSFPGLKVHAKLLMIHIGTKKYAYLATGNFNEITARIYTDFGLFTGNKILLSEIQQVFEFLTGEGKKPRFKELLVAPFNLRQSLTDLIEHEIRQAKSGRKGEILLKLNNLEDKKMITSLYRAAGEGVKVTIIVRSVCCLVPVSGIQVISIVDRFLEHARLYIFHNGGYPKYYLASADWMRRNLNRRIEVAFPVYDETIKARLREFIRFQMEDNTKARVIDLKCKNSYRKGRQEKTSNAQLNTYQYLQQLASE
jgi:polyphosphate kinase